jgi:hypothetical protein
VLWHVRPSSTASRCTAPHDCRPWRAAHRLTAAFREVHPFEPCAKSAALALVIAVTRPFGASACRDPPSIIGPSPGTSERVPTANWNVVPGQRSARENPGLGRATDPGSKDPPMLWVAGTLYLRQRDTVVPGPPLGVQDLRCQQSPRAAGSRGIRSPYWCLLGCDQEGHRTSVDLGWIVNCTSTNVSVSAAQGSVE